MKPLYRAWNNFVIRTPLFPFRAYRSWTEVLASPLFREAIAVASPDLYDITRPTALGTGAIPSDKQQNKRNFSLQKYLLRSSTRCTPFGLFAGCTIGQLADDSKIVLAAPENHKRCTRLDMQYLCALIRHLEGVPAIRRQLRFHPNDSLYEIGGKLRYIEYHYLNTRRIHEVSAVDIDEYLLRVLDGARRGAKVAELSHLLESEGIAEETAITFINELIDNQVLQSELDPAVVGDDVLTVLLAKLSSLDEVPAEFQTLQQVKALLDEVNTLSLGENHTIYEDIISLLETLGVGYERKYLFQTDLYETTRSATVSHRIPDELLRTVKFLANISMPYRNPTLQAFTEAFYKRFEEQEIALTSALDSELGIGYPVNIRSAGDVSPLLDKLAVPSPANEITVTLSLLDGVMIQKVVDCTRKGGDEIEFKDSDFPSLSNTTDSQPLPDTLAVMCSLLKDNDEDYRVLLRSAGGSSSANLLGRFCHLDSSIGNLVERIVDKEKELKPDILLAEISHLPESRIGNIASRPRFRDYVLHYLSNTDEDYGNLTADDLLLSCRHGKLTLRSKRYGKEVEPRLTCAHNHALSPIPIYRFLCDFQTRDIRGGVGFAWSPIFEQLDYLPRVRYGHTILSRQRWVVKEEELKAILAEKDDACLVRSAEGFMMRRRVVRYVVIPDGDNELFLDLQDSECWRLLGNIVGKRKRVLLEEFLFDENAAIVKDEQGRGYTNEMIFAFYKSR